MEVTALAFNMLESVEAARCYLNGDDDALGGRPIDVAGASAEGLKRVLEDLALRGSPTQPACNAHQISPQPRTT